MTGLVLLALAIAAASAPAQSMAPPPGGIVRANETPGSLEGIGIDQRLDESLPLALPFRDEAGRAVTLGDYFGKRPVVLALVYYNCPMLCTQVLNGLVASLNVMSLEAGKDFDVVAVSFDPRETPAMAAAKKEAYLSRYKHPAAAQGWHFLTGDAASITALTKAAGFRYRYDGDLDYSPTRARSSSRRPRAGSPATSTASSTRRATSAWASSKPRRERSALRSTRSSSTASTTTRRAASTVPSS